MEPSKQLKVFIFLAWSTTLASNAVSLPTTDSSTPDFDEALNTDTVVSRQSMTVSSSTSTVNFLAGGDFKQQEFDDFDGRLNNSFFKHVIRTENYDKNEVPWAEGGKPVKVQMSAYLRNVLNVDEPAQLITVETSLRMTWRDPRLTVRVPKSSPTNYVFFRQDVTDHIWFPDVYIDGIQDLRFPAYKVKPAYLRIYNDSTLKYSARVNYDVACPMHFEKYPVDTQRCNISFESWGHTNHFIELTWLREKRIFSSAIALAQFDLDVHFIEDPPSSFSLLGSYSRVTMQLVLERKITYHLFRTYLPSGLFVIIGWFSLFIPLDHVPGRVTMGMTTLLTLAAMFGAIATTTPRVSYSSKLDVWMVFCVIYVFGTLLEFTLLIFLQKQVFAAPNLRFGKSGTTSFAGATIWNRSLGHRLSTTSSASSRARKAPETPYVKQTHHRCRHSHNSRLNCDGVEAGDANANGGGRVVMTLSDLGPRDMVVNSSGDNIQHKVIPGSTFVDISNLGSPCGGVHPTSVHDTPSQLYVKAAGTSTTEDIEDEEEIRNLEREYHHKQILFKIERYGIVMFAIFFFVFNIVYWVDLLYNAKFHTAREPE